MAETVEDFLARVQAYCDAATDGPWLHGRRAMPFNRISHNLFDGNDCDITDSMANMHPDDAEFCAHARTDLPRMVAALEYVMRNLNVWYDNRGDPLTMDAEVLEGIGRILSGEPTGCIGPGCVGDEPESPNAQS